MKADDFWQSTGPFVNVILAKLGTQEPWVSRAAHNRFMEQAVVFHQTLHFLATHRMELHREFCCALANFLVKFVFPQLAEPAASNLFDVADAIMLAAHMRLSAVQASETLDARADFLQLVQSNTSTMPLQSLLMSRWRCADECAAPPPKKLDDAA